MMCDLGSGRKERNHMTAELVFWGDPSLWGNKLYQHIISRGDRARLQHPGLKWSELMSVAQAKVEADRVIDQYSGAMVGDWIDLPVSHGYNIQRRSFWARDPIAA